VVRFGIDQESVLKKEILLKILMSKKKSSPIFFEKDALQINGDVFHKNPI
jgi:hypothetical protein